MDQRAAVWRLVGWYIWSMTHLLVWDQGLLQADYRLLLVLLSCWLLSKGYQRHERGLARQTQTLHGWRIMTQGLVRRQEMYLGQNSIRYHKAREGRMALLESRPVLEKPTGSTGSAPLEDKEDVDSLYNLLDEETSSIATTLRSVGVRSRAVGVTGLQATLPPCPRCQAPMKLKSAHKGGQFLGCTRWPECRGSRRPYERLLLPDGH